MRFGLISTVKKISMYLWTVDSLINEITNAIDLSTATKVNNSKNKRLKEWISSGLLCSLRHKQQLSIQVKKHPINHELLTYYTKYKNKFTYILRAAKSNFYKIKFNKVSYSPKLT